MVTAARRLAALFVFILVNTIIYLEQEFHAIYFLKNPGEQVRVGTFLLKKHLAFVGEMFVRSTDVQTREKHRKDKRARSKVPPVFLELAICCRFVLMCLRVTPAFWHFHVKTMSSHRQTTLDNICLCASVRTEKGKVLLSWLRLKKGVQKA